MTEPATQRSSLSRRWTIKMSVIALLLIGFGLWGLYDAMIRYPARGSEAAENIEYQYLQQLADDHREYSYDESVKDPAGRLAKLEAGPESSAKADTLLKQWLEQLQIIGHLDYNTATKIPRTDFRADDKGNHVQVTSFSQRLSELRTAWTSGAGRSAPPLSRHDIHMQWVIVVAGVGFGGYLLLLMLAARSRVYTWDAASQKLTVPGGAALLPADIAEFDKRKWHRLFITLKVKSSHPQLGGKDVEIDLLRYEPVEEWVLAMERTAFPESAEKAEEKPSSAAPAAP